MKKRLEKFSSEIMKLYFRLRKMSIVVPVILWALGFAGPKYWFAPVLNTLLIAICTFGMIKEDKVEMLKGLAFALAFGAFVWVPYLAYFV